MRASSGIAPAPLDLHEDAVRYRFGRLGLFRGCLTDVNLDRSAPHNSKSPPASATNLGLNSLQGLITIKRVGLERFPACAD